MSKPGYNKNDKSKNIQAKLNVEGNKGENEDSESTKKTFYTILIVISIVSLAIIYFVLYVAMVPKPEPPRPEPIEDNPYKIVYMENINDKIINLVLYNQRENPSTISSMSEENFNDANISDNYEPLYLNATFTFIDKYLVEFKLTDANLSRMSRDLFYHSQSDDASIYSFINYNFSKFGIDRKSVV